MRADKLALAIAAALIATPALAMPPNHTVTFTVPVSISNMPYVKAFTVGCQLTYPEGTRLTSEMSGAAYGRADHDIVGGAFHGTVQITITALNGPAPNGYQCKLYVTPSDGSAAFQPLDPAKYPGAPPEHLAAQGTSPVTEVSGHFGATQFRRMQPLHFTKPLGQ